MFEIHVVDASNRSAYEAYLEQHHRIRHEIYVHERGWHDLARLDGREIDAFDTPDAIYLLGIAPIHGVVAGSRLVPSLKPHLMSEVFADLAAGHVPRASDIFEWTRFFVVPALREPGRPCRAAGIVCCGILELCLQRRIRRLSIVCEDYWYERFAAIGWNPRRLGKTPEHGDAVLIGLTVDVSKAALCRTRYTYGIQGSVLYNERTPRPPAI